MKGSSTVTFGCDLGDRYVHICGIWDDDGEHIIRERITTTPASLNKFFKRRAAARIVVEVGCHSPWVSELLGRLGHEVIVANARKVKLISQNDSKCDETDAELLARLGRADIKLLSPIKHRSPQTRRDAVVLSARNRLVEIRTKLMTFVRGTAKSFGESLRAGGSSSTFTKRARLALSPELRKVFEPALKTIDAINEQVKAAEQHAERELRNRYPEMQLLEQVDGVGTITALSYILTIEDPGRFRRSRQVGAYLGLRPKRSQSGKSDPQMRITKAGDRELRRLLVLSAHYILGPFGKDSDLRRWGLARAAAGGKSAKKKAVTAVARRLAVLLHRLWVTGEVYQPLGYCAAA